MTGVERIIKALKREVPDRVPHMELGIDKKVREAILKSLDEHTFPGISFVCQRAGQNIVNFGNTDRSCEMEVLTQLDLPPTGSDHLT